MIFSDNQTKHFYVLDGTTENTHYAVKVLNSGDLRRFVAMHSDGNETSDIINKKLVKSAVVNQVKPTYFRQWVAAIPVTVTAATTYRVYFYLENMLGFGIQDRFDRVASYTTGASETTGLNVATAIKNDLDSQLNDGGPVKGDFTVALGTTSNSASYAPAFAQATANPAKSIVFDTNKFYYLPTGHTAGAALSAVTDKVEVDLVVVRENSTSSTYKFNELDMRMHTNPYAYNVTMSTAVGDDDVILDQKEIKATNTSTVYIKAAQKVKAMELYFMRNRADLYDLNKDFYTSILNNTHVTSDDQAYYTIDIDYAYSDTLGFTYHSDKQMSVAVPTSTKSDATTIMNKILSIS